MFSNKEKISKKQKTISIGRRFAAGESKASLAKEYNIQVATVTNYLDRYKRLYATSQ